MSDPLAELRGKTITNAVLALASDHQSLTLKFADGSSLKVYSEPWNADEAGLGFTYGYTEED